MQTTTNFGLKEYESGDYFNPLTVENYNTGKIDTEMKAVADKTIGRATELVSGGVHAITLLDTDCKTFQFTATGNYTALETFTLNGIAINAYMPDGSALTTDAYKTGAVVMCARNSDDSALTFYLSSVGGVAPDSLKLGGELPAYYSTKSYADDIKTTADTASELIQKKALVNTYYDTSVNKLYIVNVDGTKGSEIKMARTLDLSNMVRITTTAMTTTNEGVVFGSAGQTNGLVVNGNNTFASTTGETCDVYLDNIPAGTTLKLKASDTDSGRGIWFAPYA